MEKEPNIKINYALLKKNRVNKAKIKAEDDILNKISVKVYRSEEQRTERKRKRKQSNIKINHRKL